MTRRYIRIGQLASTPTREGMLPVSAPTIWRWVKIGKFPQPLKLGPQTTAWPLEAVEQFLQACATQPGGDTTSAATKASLVARGDRKAAGAA